jgi:hypothetical protein
VSGDQSGNADMLIEFRPFNGVAGSQELPVLPFSSRGMKKARIPIQRNCHRPAVRKIHEQFLVANLYA